MNRILIIFVILVSYSGCTKYRINTNYSQQIKGLWICEYTTTESLYSQRAKSSLVFSFEDSMCDYLSHGKGNVPYILHGDTLLIINPHDLKIVELKCKYSTYKFLIDSIINGFLYLKSLNPEAIDKLSDYGYKSHEIKLRKVNPKNTLQFDRIGFYSSTCYGHCPSMYFEIDSIGNIFFHGYKYTLNDGLYAGTISHKEMTLINKKIHFLELDSLKTSYLREIADVPQLGVWIRKGNNIYKSVVNDKDYAPVELDILMNKLITVNKSATLHQDSSVSGKFQFSDIKYRYLNAHFF